MLASRAIIAVVAGALLGCTASAPPAAVAQAIVNGSADNDDPNIVALMSNGAFTCTAEVISPHVILTAGHCSVAPAGTAYSVYFGNDVHVAGRTIAVTEIHADPGYRPDVVDAAHDLAIAILAEPAAVAPLSYNRVPIPDSWNDPRRPHGARLVGFGLASPSDGTSYGARRQTGLPIVGLRPEAITYSNHGFSGTCFGDSGGPAIARIAGNEAIISVTSYGFGSIVNACDLSHGDVEARVDTYHAFIDEWVTRVDPPARQGQLGDACDTNLDCASAICGSSDDGKTRFCTATCDPSASGVCGTLSCTSVDDIHVCMPGGCDLAAGGAPSNAGLVLIALALVAVRARRRRASAPICSIHESAG
ncbi:MAG: hypothetical protein JWN44_4530 [Myxococcales bacterium]|nr:hypothetical protein [Myxococcales bacterium]